MAEYNPYDEEFNSYLDKFMESKKMPFFDGVKNMDMGKDIDDFFKKYPDYKKEDFDELTFSEGLKKIHDVVNQ